MSTIPITRSKHIAAYSVLLERSGFTVGSILRQCNLPCDCLEDPDTLIPSNRAFQFREVAAKELELKNAALPATQKLNISDLGQFGQSLLKTPTLSKLIAEFQRLFNSETSMATVNIKMIDGGNVSFDHRFLFKSKTELLQSDLYILQWQIKAIQLVNPNWLPGKVWIRSEETPTSREAIEQLGVKNIKFNQDSSGFLIPSSMLSLPINNRKSLNKSHYENSSKNLPGSNWIESLKQMVESYSNDRWLSANETAEVIGESKRTLQRRLSEEKTTYSEILQDVRTSKAALLLESTDMKISVIARQLGYSSEGNFSRAFHRWSGVSPRDFRKQRKKLPG